MTAPLNVVAVAGSLIAPSKTTALAELILRTLQAVNGVVPVARALPSPERPSPPDAAPIV
ncbi:hypothetical protein OG894_00490 [Streptomyces sp. NBC_01724]|uniref:hypothetical protein n=1 Tax=unclassified Streptomyces TaxID=2593676 RepID=UPI002E2FAC35|nr:hypothetical protein [Streptomyces sp. NBC_01724]WTE57384.1 hypothetical protein OG784_00465 [Streptomyces sp. NBC_01617]WTE64744.1 hypothetical protein OG784_41880 [Streptomyces sp. NBC_01617]